MKISWQIALRNREKAHVFAFADFTQYNSYLYHENKNNGQKSTMSKIIISLVTLLGFFDCLI